MTQRPPLPPLSKNTSPRKDKALVAQTSRPMPIRNSFYQSPRTNLYQSTSSNEYGDPIENIKEYKRLSKQISSIKMSMIPLNEQLFQLQSFFGPIPIDKETENQQQEFDSLIKEKEALDDEIALARRTYNEYNFINQQADIDFLRSKLREGGVFLAKVENSLDKSKEERDYYLNSETKTEIINAKKRAKELNKELSNLRKEGDSLISQYCQKLTKITEGKDNDQQQIDRRKLKIRKQKHEVESKKFELRRMKREHDEKVKDLKDKIKLKKAQKKRFDQSQNWKERTKVSFDDDDKNGSKYNPYVTTYPVNYNQYKIVAPQDGTNSPRKKQGQVDNQTNDKTVDPQNSPQDVKDDEATNQLGLMYQHFPNQLNKNFDNEEEMYSNSEYYDTEEDINEDQEKNNQQLENPLLEEVTNKITDKLNGTKSGNESEKNNKEAHQNEDSKSDQKDDPKLNDKSSKDGKQKDIKDDKNENTQSDEDSKDEGQKEVYELADEDSKNDDVLSDDDDNQEDVELEDDDEESSIENSKDNEELEDESENSEDNSVHPLDNIGSNIASSLRESGNDKDNVDKSNENENNPLRITNLNKKKD